MLPQMAPTCLRSRSDISTHNTKQQSPSLKPISSIPSSYLNATSLLQWILKRSRFPFPSQIGLLKEESIQVSSLSVPLVPSCTKLNHHSTANTLSIKIRTHTGEPINNQQNITTTTIAGGFQQTATNFSTPNIFGLISFLQVAEFNRNGTFHELATINVLQLTNESNSTSTAFIMQFQGYFDQVLYDPDFGVLVAPQGTSSSGLIPSPSRPLLIIIFCYEGDGGSNLGLIIGLSVGIPVAFLIVLLVIVVGSVATFIVRHKKRAKLHGHLAQVTSNTSGIAPWILWVISTLTVIKGLNA